MNIEQILIDIEKIDKALKKGTLEILRDTNQYLVGTYIDIIRQTNHAWRDTSNEYIDRHNEDAYQGEKLERLTESQIIANYKFNLEMIKSKMRLSIPNKIEESPSTFINVYSSSSAENRNKINIEMNVTFNDVREQIKSMESTIDEKDVKEILEKINELEKIIESKEKNYVKWKNARNIGKWILDKSVDVGIALLPLFLKIGA